MWWRGMSCAKSSLMLFCMGGQTQRIVPCSLSLLFNVGRVDCWGWTPASWTKANNTLRTPKVLCWPVAPGPSQYRSLGRLCTGPQCTQILRENCLAVQCNHTSPHKGTTAPRWNPSPTMVIHCNWHIWMACQNAFCWTISLIWKAPQ